MSTDTTPAEKRKREESEESEETTESTESTEFTESSEETDADTEPKIKKSKKDLDPSLYNHVAFQFALKILKGKHGAYYDLMPEENECTSDCDDEGRRSSCVRGYRLRQFIECVAKIPIAGLDGFDAFMEDLAVRITRGEFYERFSDLRDGAISVTNTEKSVKELVHAHVSLAILKSCDLSAISLSDSGYFRKYGSDVSEILCHRTLVMLFVMFNKGMKTLWKRYEKRLEDVKPLISRMEISVIKGIWPPSEYSDSHDPGWKKKFATEELLALLGKSKLYEKYADMFRRKLTLPEEQVWFVKRGLKLMEEP